MKNRVEKIIASVKEANRVFDIMEIIETDGSKHWWIVEPGISQNRLTKSEAEKGVTMFKQTNAWAWLKNYV